MESKSKEYKGPGFIELVLLIISINSFFSAIIWSTKTFGDEPDTWTWFSRFAIGVISLGLAGIIREIRKTKEKDEVPHT